MDKEYRKLELDKVLRLLSEEAQSDECREKCLNIEPVFDIDGCRELLKRTDDAFTLSSKFGTPRFSKIKNVCKSADRASGGAVLSSIKILSE